MKPTETHQKLHKLLESNEDSQRAFHAAASAVSDPQLQRQFHAWALERETYCTQLRNLLTILNAPRLFVEFEKGSAAGFFQRAWMHIASAVYTRDEIAIIKACQTGEHWSNNVYETALAGELPSEVREVVETQFTGVTKVQSSLKELLLRAEKGNKCLHT